MLCADFILELSGPLNISMNIFTASPRPRVHMGCPFRKLFWSILDMHVGKLYEFEVGNFFLSKWGVQLGNLCQDDVHLGKVFVHLRCPNGMSKLGNFFVQTGCPVRKLMSI